MYLKNHIILGEKEKFISFWHQIMQENTFIITSRKLTSIQIKMFIRIIMYIVKNKLKGSFYSLTGLML